MPVRTCRVSVLLAFAVLVACQPDAQTSTASPAAEMTAPATAVVDFDALAERLVTQSIGIREGDRVLISGGPDDIELLEDLAVRARSVGAFPLIALQSDRLTRRMVVDVPEKFDTQTNALDLAMADLFDVAIQVDQATAPDLLADVPDERLARRAEANAPVAQAFESSNVRMVNLGNAMNPSPANATRLGISQDELTRVFWAAVGADPVTLQTRGDALRNTLAAGKVLHITSPSGTDLTVNIAERPAFVSDGRITEDEAMKGGASAYLWLPAGEVYLAPVPGTAEGRVVVEEQWYEGKAIPGFTATFAGGRLTGMSATSGIEPLQSAYDVVTAEGKDQFAFVDFGVNPAARSDTGTPIRTWVAEGVVSVGIGNNTWAGGANNAPFGLSLHILNATVTLDGATLIEGGVLRPAS